MPYRRSGNCVEVFKNDRWRKLRCHESSDAAESHLTALQINVRKIVSIHPSIARQKALKRAVSRRKTISMKRHDPKQALQLIRSSIDGISYLPADVQRTAARLGKIAGGLQAMAGQERTNGNGFNADILAKAAHAARLAAQKITEYAGSVSPGRYSTLLENGLRTVKVYIKQYEDQIKAMQFKTNRALVRRKSIKSEYRVIASQVLNLETIVDAAANAVNTGDKRGLFSSLQKIRQETTRISQYPLFKNRSYQHDQNTLGILIKLIRVSSDAQTIIRNISGLDLSDRSVQSDLSSDLGEMRDRLHRTATALQTFTRKSVSAKLHDPKQALALIERHLGSISTSRNDSERTFQRLRLVYEGLRAMIRQSQGKPVVNFGSASLRGAATQIGKLLDYINRGGMERDTPEGYTDTVNMRIGNAEANLAQFRELMERKSPFIRKKALRFALARRKSAAKYKPLALINNLIRIASRLSTRPADARTSYRAAQQIEIGLSKLADDTTPAGPLSASGVGRELFHAHSVANNLPLRYMYLATLKPTDPNLPGYQEYVNNAVPDLRARLNKIRGMLAASSSSRSVRLKKNVPLRRSKMESRFEGLLDVIEPLESSLAAFNVAGKRYGAEARRWKGENNRNALFDTSVTLALDNKIDPLKFNLQDAISELGDHPQLSAAKQRLLKGKEALQTIEHTILTGYYSQIAQAAQVVFLQINAAIQDAKRYINQSAY